jgi:hypothetical protein
MNHLHDHAKRCLELFVCKMGSLFGETSVGYNVHTLLHIHEFVKMYGNLNNFSSFPFENHLSHLKKRIVVTKSIFKHVLNQLLEVRSINTNDPTASPLFFSHKSPNNCAVVNGKKILITDVKEDIISGYVLQFSKPLYTYPYSSEVLGIGKYDLTRNLVSGKASNKCFCIPVAHNYFLVIPFCN